MQKVKNFNVTLDPVLVKKAREKLQLGQKLSPVLNQLLKDWVDSQSTETQKKDLQT